LQRGVVFSKELRLKGNRGENKEEAFLKSEFLEIAAG
jgi:hypothetical protein